MKIRLIAGCVLAAWFAVMTASGDMIGYATYSLARTNDAAYIQRIQKKDSFKDAFTSQFIGSDVFYDRMGAPATHSPL